MNTKEIIDKKFTLHLLVGLPGSGKSTFAVDLVKNNSDFYYLDTDKIREYYFKNKTDLKITDVIEYGLKTLKRYQKNYNTIILDGLFLTNDNILKTLKYLEKHFVDLDVIIHKWNKDRDICIKNDGNRRELSSFTTIKYSTFEDIDINYLNEELTIINIIDIINHKVILSPIFYRKLNHCWDFNKKIIESDRWCLGGISCDCYGDECYIHEEPQKEFTTLKEILYKAFPNLNEDEYIKIRNKSSKIITYDESDYYGGSVTYSCWNCKINDLKETLEELNYIKEDDYENFNL